MLYDGPKWVGVPAALRSYVGPVFIGLNPASQYAAHILIVESARALPCAT
jgi:hypothetical protein